MVKNKAILLAFYIALFTLNVVILVMATMATAPMVFSALPAQGPTPTVDMTDGQAKTRAAALFSEAQELYERKNWQEALAKFQEAGAIYRAAGYGGNAAICDAFVGKIYYDRREYDNALLYFDQALRVFHKTGFLEGQAGLYAAITLIYEDQGAYGKALEYLQRGIPVFQELGYRNMVASSHNKMGVIYGVLGEYQHALEQFQKALPLFQELRDQSGESTVYNHMGEIYRALGDYQTALKYQHKALQLQQEINDPIGIVTSYNNIGVVYRYRGEYQIALGYYQKVLDISRSALLGIYEAHSYLNIGIIYRLLGDYPRALAYYQKALAIAQAIDDKMGVASSHNSIGDVYVQIGDYPKALDHFQKALPIFEALNYRAAVATVYDNMGQLSRHLGNYEQAIDYHQKALTQRIVIGDPRGVATSYGGIGNVYLSLREYETAIEHHQKALDIAREIGDRGAQSTAYGNIGVDYEGLGENQSALEYYLKAIDSVEKIRGELEVEEFKGSFIAGKVDVYEYAILLLLKLNKPTEAFHYIERARARTFLDQIGNVRLDIRKGVASQLVEQEQALRLNLAALDRNLRQERTKPRDQQNTGLIQSLSTQLITKQRGYEDLLIRIKLANPEYASLVSVTPLTLSEIQNLLDKDTTLLAYFVTTDKTLAFVVTRESFEAVELPMSEKDLNAAISEFRGFASLSDASPPSLKQLYTWLIAPLKSHLKTPVVGIIPHGVLHYLPFAALTDGQRYLGDDYTLFYLPSASALPFIQQKRKSSNNSLLVLAQSQAEGLPVLRYADREAQAIAKLYDTQALLSSAATESTFKASASNYTILHLAAHGQLNTASPLFSRIALAPDKDDDGSLEVHEVYGVDLAKADLVVLSACQTQLGAHSRGDDIVGLNRAFIYAGTPTVIASLWSVDDQATSVLMTSFYTHLKQGKGKAEALHSAQVETRAKYPHPYYWAAFVLTGDPGTMPAPVPESQPTPTPFPLEVIWFIGIAAAVILLGLAFWFKRR